MPYFLDSDAVQRDAVMVVWDSKAPRHHCEYVWRLPKYLWALVKVFNIPKEATKPYFWKKKIPFVAATSQFIKHEIVENGSRKPRSMQVGPTIGRKMMRSVIDVDRFATWLGSCNIHKNKK